MARVLRFPPRGRLIVCTDLQGCLRDFHTIVDVFTRTMEENDNQAYILFTGDLIHGPHMEESEWPEYLGEFYHDQSPQLVKEFVELRKTYPGRIHALVGNHEHGHIGGPHTAKFALDEVATLEKQMGSEQTSWFCEVLETFALAAVAPCGTVFTHGAPAAQIASIASVEAVNLTADYWHSPVDILQVPVIGPILWARSASPDQARKFVSAMGGRISVFGHDVIPEGFETIGDEQIIVSTSFGVFDSNKVYLDLDLSAKYVNVHALRVGHEIRPLYPAKAPTTLGGEVETTIFYDEY